MSYTDDELTIGDDTMEDELDLDLDPVLDDPLEGDPLGEDVLSEDEDGDDEETTDEFAGIDGAEY